MHVTIAHPHFLKPGGATKVVLELSKQIINKGIKVTVITTKINPEITDNYKGIEFHCISNRSTGDILFWPLLPFFLKKFRNEVIKVKPDIIFSHSLAFYWLMGLKKVQPKVPITYYCHDLGLPYIDSKAELGSLPLGARIIMAFLRPIVTAVNLSILKQIDAIIANSQLSAKFFEARYHRAPQSIVTPGIDSEVFSPSGSKEDYVYTAGRLEKIKRTDLIIVSFARYLKSSQNQDLKLQIIGEGLERESLKELAKNLGIEDRVVFLGVKSPEEVASIAARAKVGLFLCPVESFGIASVESMGCGTPVVGANQGGISEIVIDGQTGFLVDPEPKMVEQALVKILENNNYLLLGQQARQHVVAHYTWEKAGDNLVNTFKSLES